MKDAWFGEPIIGQLLNPGPREAILLAASPERPPPETRDVGPEGRECAKVRRHCVVVEEAGDDLPEPMPLLGYRLVHSVSHFPLDLLELRRHAVTSGLPLDEEFSPAGPTADEGETQEVEGLRFAEPTSNGASTP
jgi:hypothetical protein